MEGEWSCYGGCQFNGGRMVMLQRYGHFNRERMNGHVTAGGQFKGGSMVMLP